MIKNIFENYKAISNMNDGLVSPLELNNDKEILRMSLDNKELIVDIQNDVVYLQDSYSETLIEELGRPKQLSNIIDSVISLSYITCHYSLNNLKNSIK